MISRYTAGVATTVVSRLCQYSCATTPSIGVKGGGTTAEMPTNPAIRCRCAAIASANARLVSRKKVPLPLCAEPAVVWSS